MNPTIIRSNIKSKVVTLSFLLGILIVGGVSVQAQYPYRGRDWDRGSRHSGYGNIFQIARDRGYQDGLNVGADDAYKRKSYDPGRSHYFKSGTDGYSSSYGNKNAYKDAFRDGFTRGYQQGFRRNTAGRGRYDRRY